MQNKSRFNHLALVSHINMARIAIDHIGSFKSLLGFFIRSLKLTFKCPLRPGSPARNLLSDLPAIPVDLAEILSSQDSPNILRFLYLQGSDPPFSPGKAAENPIIKVPYYFSRGLYWHRKVNFCSLKLSAHIWVYACLSQIWLSSQSLGDITFLINTFLIVSCDKENRFLLKLCK